MKRSSAPEGRALPEISDMWRSIRAAARTAVFLLKLMPMLPSKGLNYLTPEPVVEKLEYPSSNGPVKGDVYRPSGEGPFPAAVVCLGVVPFGEDHPQVPRLGEALARAGFAALLYWSPAMRDFRLDPEDIENIALAYDFLLAQSFVDPKHSGLIGTCVGGSFALMAGASPRIRERVKFIGAFAPYGSLLSLGRDIASGTRLRGSERVAWPVDQITQRVFVHSVTAHLKASEAGALRDAFDPGGDRRNLDGLSPDARAILALFTAGDASRAETAISSLPVDIKQGLADLSPINYLQNIQAPAIAISHDRDDLVIPVDESRLLYAALRGRTGVRYTEFAMFEHADPTKRKLSPLRLAWQMSRFYLWLHALFREAIA